MPRPPNPQIRTRFLEGAIDYTLEHGLEELSLRPLATRLDTSARMLIYHFGSYEGLMRAILAGLREREDRRIQAWLSEGPAPRSIGDFLLWYWERVATSGGRSAARLVFELYARALRHPADYPGVLDEPLAYWRALLHRMGVTSTLGDAQATMLLASFRGLLLDFCATGDSARTTQALELLVRSLERRPRSRNPESA
jgi:AcrR family transcriptional regulator